MAPNEYATPAASVPKDHGWMHEIEHGAAVALRVGPTPEPFAGANVT